jgi:hypothetical protein
MVEMTPLVDVVFLLVIFFLVAAEASRMARPPAALLGGPGEAPVGAQWDTMLTLGSDGLWRETAGGPALTDPSTLAIGPGAHVLLRVDRSAPGGALLSMTQALEGLGLDRVELALGREVDP